MAIDNSVVDPMRSAIGDYLLPHRHTALLEAVWAVRKTAGGETRSGRTIAREAVEGEGFDALAAAHSRALARMSGDIAAAIRAEAGKQP